MNKVLIVYPYANIATNPTMCVLVQSLAMAGYHVDLVVDTAHANEFPKFLLSGGKHRPLNFDDRLWWQPKPSGIAKRIWQICRQPSAIDPAWFKRFRSKNYSCILGVDPIGIVTASQLNAIAKVPLVYVSFEMIPSDETESYAEDQLKAVEKQASRSCDLIMIQDQDRANVFAEDNGIGPDKFCFVPVAPAGDLPNKTDYLRDQLNIAPEQSIVLFQGTMAAWSGRDEWEALLSCWTDNIALVVHSRRRLGTRSRKFLNRLASRYPVYISDQPVSQDELSILTASADVGLVSYFPNPETWQTLGNLEPIGLASGKLSTFLMCGVPVLTSQRTSLGRLVEDQRLGAAYDSVESSVESLNRILATRDELSASARSFYENHLDPTKPIADFIDRLGTL